jgi:hypothetical protein
MSCASGDCNCEAALKAITTKLDAIEGSMRDHAAATDAKLDAFDAKLDAKLDAMEQRMIRKLRTLIRYAIEQSGTSGIVPRHQRIDATVARQDYDAAETATLMGRR